ncbi:MAG: hypothetical protein K1W28_14400 [Lachnospiraceae bacterium]
MKKGLRKLYIAFRIQMRLFRLFFLRVRKPEDAMTQEEMLEEIKRRSGMT